MSRSYRQLFVWQKAKKLAADVYRETGDFPKAETYGLTSQIRKAVVSIAANIAEGQGRLTRGEFKQFLGHARGSLLELETHLAIALDLGFIKPAPYAELDRLRSARPSQSAAVFVGHRTDEPTSVAKVIPKRVIETLKP